MHQNFKEEKLVTSGLHLDKKLTVFCSAVLLFFFFLNYKCTQKKEITPNLITLHMTVTNIVLMFFLPGINSITSQKNLKILTGKTTYKSSATNAKRKVKAYL